MSKPKPSGQLRNSLLRGEEGSCGKGACFCRPAIRLIGCTHVTPPRIRFEGTVNHVTSRGDRCEAIFEDDEDRVALLAIVAWAWSDSALRRLPIA